MLYSKTLGSGKNLVLLHGWGFNSALFNQLVNQYQDQYCITVIDLPGHGQSENIAGGLEAWCNEIIAVLPAKPILLGWSLGGLLAIHIAAQMPLSKLILVACTPNFVQTEQWRYGIAADNFKQFAAALKLDLSKTLKRFISLQSKNKSQLKVLNEAIDKFPATPQALNQGLEILLNSDLVAEFRQLKLPIKVILGDNDTLVANHIANWYRHNNVDTVTLNTGHLPFLHKNFKL